MGGRGNGKGGDFWSPPFVLKLRSLIINYNNLAIVSILPAPAAP